MLDASRRRSGSVHHPFSEPSSDEEPLDDVSVPLFIEVDTSFILFQSPLHDVSSASQVPIVEPAAPPPSTQTLSMPFTTSSSTSVPSDLPSPTHLPDETNV